MDSGSSSTVATQFEGPEFVIEGQIVLILCGLIGSGKSTFAAALQQHFPQIRRCNQDDLGDRRRVERLARATLSDGQSVCIDRTNFNPTQRSYWIDIAQEVPGAKIWVIVFDTPYNECAARLRTRQNHPTISNAKQGLIILSRFAADFEHPSPHEGYHRILYVKPEDTRLNYTRPDIASILQRVRDSPQVDSSGIHGPARQRVGLNPVHRGWGYLGRRPYKHQQ